MKRLIFSFGILIFVFLWILHTAATDTHAPVNPVIGDISFIKKFGHPPTPQTDENLRIETHLEYAELMLRKNTPFYLNKTAKIKRDRIIKNLRAYRTAGIFPKNHDFKDQRRPCFIDRNGNICAVGYLVEKTAGRDLAESINRDFQYSNISEMNSTALSAWLKENGLSLEEAAIIQPSYDWEPGQPAEPVKINQISKSYAISSSVFSGVNLALNGIQLMKSKHGKLASKLGLFTGAAQVAFGTLTYPAKVRDQNGVTTTNQSKKVLSLTNIGIGSGTMLLSTWKLLKTSNPVKERSYSWDIYQMPLPDDLTALALSVKHKF